MDKMLAVIADNPVATAAGLAGMVCLAVWPCWTAHDRAVGSLPGLVAYLLSIATGATMLLQRSSVIATAVMAARKLVAGRI